MSGSSRRGGTVLAERPFLDFDGSVLQVEGLTVTVEVITPQDAERYLRTNKNVRKLRTAVVNRYARDMSNDDWHLGTSVIGFDAEGNLRCGQHRLTACVQSGVPFTTIVARGLTESAVDNDDQGLKRTTGDVLHAKGETNGPALAAVIANCYRWDAGEVLQSYALTPTQVQRYLADNPGVRDAAMICRPLMAAPLHARVSAVGPFIFRIRQIDDELADLFVRGLHSGADLPEHDPILKLRMYYLAKRGNQYGRPSRVHELALCVKAWNAWLTGRPVKALRWGRGASGQEEFPALLGTNGRAWPFPDVKSAMARERERLAAAENESAN